MNSQKQSPHSIKPPQAKNKGFALIVALTMMSFMVILVLSLATLLNVEMQTASHQNRLDEARTNALLGAQIALGQLQLYAGPDQRVTAPATVAYPQKTSPGVGEMWDIYREHATGMPTGSGAAPDTWHTYLIEDFDDNEASDQESWDQALDDWWADRNPHWMGVYKSNKLDGDGNLVNGGDFDRQQSPHWLISGNEQYSDDNIAGQMTPDTILDPESNDVAILVGYGSAAPRTSDDPEDAISSDGLDGRVLAPKIDITDSDSLVSGQYAYWVGDENMKANFSILDPYFDAASGSIEERFRLQVPQRLGWEQIAGYKEIFDTFDGDVSAQNSMINNKQFEIIETTSQIVLTTPDPEDDDLTADYQDAARENFHHISGFSKGIFTDTVLGGLQKDLTRYFENGEGATNGKISDSNPIPDPDGSDIFGYNDDPRFGLYNQGFPNSTLNVPTWEGIREWYTNEVQAAGDDEGEIEVTAATTPIITQIRLFVGFSREGDELRLNVLPQIVLWNPYDAGLKEGTYDIRIKFEPILKNFRIASETLATQSTAELNPATVREYVGAPNYHNHRLSRANADIWTHNSRQIVDDSGSIVVTHSANALHMISDHPNLSPVEPDSVYPPDEDVFFDSYDINIFPDECELSLIITHDFKAGEHLMFSVGEDHEIEENDIGGTPVAIIELQNVFDSDAPASAYHHFATLDYDPASERSAYWADSAVFIPPPTQEFQVKIFANGELIRDYGSFGNLAGGGGFMSNFLGSRNADVMVDQPMIWPTLYTPDEFSAAIVGDRDPNLNPSGGRSGPMDIPIMLVGENYLDPLYFRGTGPIDTLEAGATSFRPFANYNIMAKQFSSNNPMVDGVRAAQDWGNGNSGGERMSRFEAINGIQSRNNSQPSVPDYFTGENIGVDKRNDWNARSDTSKNSAGNVITDRGNPWNAFSTQRRAETVDGRTLAYNFIQQTKLPDGLSRKPNDNPKVDALSLVPVRLAYRPEFDIVSLGQLQQVNLSEFMWQPAYAIGNAEASPYIDRDRIAGLTSRPVWQYYTTDPDNLPLKDSTGNYVGAAKSWKSEGLGNNQFNHLLDVSYLLNESLWDHYFFSTIPNSGSVSLDNSKPLGNSRIKFNTNKEFDISDARDFDNAASYLYNDGAFNINSTSVEAWKALLTAFRDIKLYSINDGDDTNPIDSVPVSRSLEPLRGAIDFTFDDTTNDPVEYGAGPSPTGYNNYDKAFGGYRYLTDDMIETLSERIVDEVRLRGPFFSMADFVNRRLDAPDGLSRTESGQISYSNNHYLNARKDANLNTGYDALVGLHSINGTIQRALNVSGINGGVNYPTTAGHNTYKRYDAMFNPRKYSTANTESWGSDWRWVAYPSLGWYTDSEARAGAPAGEQGLLLSHSPGFITQADILSMIGPVLRPRGDTFIIRSYGSSINKLTGEVEAEAWLEMTVQRVVDPVNPDSDDPFKPMTPQNNGIDLGRKFEILNFRWLTENEV